MLDYASNTKIGSVLSGAVEPPELLVTDYVLQPLSGWQAKLVAAEYIDSAKLRPVVPLYKNIKRAAGLRKAIGANRMVMD